MKYWREKDALFKVACKYLGHQVFIRKAFAGKELTKINTIADAYRTWRWKLMTSSSLNSKYHSKGWQGWHYRSIQKLVLCLNIVRNKGQVDNFIHGDLHPGNIFVRSDGVHPQIVVLDVGMAIELSQRSRSLLFELFKAASFRDGKTVAKCTLELSREQSCSNTNQFIRDVDEKFKKYLSVRGSAKNTGECMTDLFDEVRRHHVNIDGDVCTVMVTSLIHEGWQRKLDPDLDILDILRKQLAKDEYSKLFRNFMMGVVAL